MPLVYTHTHVRAHTHVFFYRITYIPVGAVALALVIVCDFHWARLRSGKHNLALIKIQKEKAL